MKFRRTRSPRVVYSVFKHNKLNRFLAPTNHYYCFGSFKLDPQNRILLEEGERVRLTPRMFDLLLYLVEDAGRVISHDEFLDRIWANILVTNAVLVQNIAALRRVLGQGKDGANFIETIPKLGYRFATPVEVTEALAPREPRIAIAVLPFQDASTGRKRTQAADRHFLSVSLADALTLRLGRFTDITVRPVSSMLGNLINTNDPAEAGRKLDVRYVVAGQFEVANDAVAVTVDLIRVAREQSVWRGRFVFTATNALDMERRIVKHVHDEVTDKAVSPGGDNDNLAPTPNVLAHKEYLKGRYFWNRRSTEDIYKAVECFQRSVELDPEFGLAFSGLSDCYTQLIHFGAIRPSDAIPKARNAAARAMELNPESSESHASWAYILAGYDWDWLAAEHEFRTAIELNPNNITVRHWLATLYVVMQQPSRALDTLGGAREVDPLSPILDTNFGMNLYFMKEFERAEAELNAVLDLEPAFAPAALYLGRVYQVQGRYQDAVEQFSAAHEIFWTKSTKAELALAHLLAGNERKGRQILDSLLACANEEYVSPYALALIYEALGDRQTVEKYLNAAFEEHSITMMWFAIEPRFRAVRRTAFGQDLLERANHLPSAAKAEAAKVKKLRG